MSTPLEALIEDMGDLATTPLGLELQHYVMKMQETCEPSWVDLAVWRVTQEQLALPKTLQILASRIAKERLMGAGQRRALAPAMRQHFHDLESALMASFIGLEYKPADAAAFTANCLYAVFGYAPLASSIRRRYNSKSENSGLYQGIASAVAGQAAKRNDAADELRNAVERLPERQRGVYN
jgi:hypothetical protein